jgi:cation:H+ antiporter
VLTSGVFLFAGLLLLYFGGDWLVKGASALALRAGLSPFIVGMTIVGFSTSSPELAVSIDSVLSGVDDVAVGNVVGSNIANIGLVLGLSAVLRPIRVEARVLRGDMPWLLLVTLFVAWCLADGGIGRFEGLILVIGLVLFIAHNMRVSRHERASVLAEFSRAAKEPSISRHRRWVLLLVGVVALIGGAALFVEGAVDLALRTGVSTGLIGLTIVAVGTSLPELATSVVASLRGEGDIAVGNVIGSNFFNLLCILGLTVMVHPLAMGDVRAVDLYVMAGMTGLLLPIMFTGFRIGRREGLLLLLCYGGYVAMLADRGLSS